MPFPFNLPRMAFRRFALGAVAAFGFGSLFLAGCSTDLDPNADYKEITVLYSVLNPAEKIHYVKVTKAFQNSNADARDIAANIPDSAPSARPSGSRRHRLQVLGEMLEATRSCWAALPASGFLAAAFGSTRCSVPSSTRNAESSLGLASSAAG